MALELGQAGDWANNYSAQGDNFAPYGMCLVSWLGDDVYG